MTHPHKEEKLSDMGWEDKFPPGTTFESKSDAWHTVKVVLCTAIVFGFLSYLAYLSQGH